MHHKRKRPKSTRAGCLLCKPHKRQGSCRHERAKHSDRARLSSGGQQLNEIGLKPDCGEALLSLGKGLEA